MTSEGIGPLFISPGPDRIEPSQHPGGVVIHIYAATDPPLLVTTHKLGPGDDIEAAAEGDAAAFDAFTAGPSCLVAYDGDTGERFPAEAWHG